MNTFPEGMDDDYKRIANANKPIVSSMLFGNRFKADQTLYEYLIEFLLVFTSAKEADLKTGKNHFHSVFIERKFDYWVEPRMALRRFIFYDKARKNGVIKADEEAYQEMMKILLSKMDEIPKEQGREYLESIQDLFHGYAVVIKKRFWGAQALLPVCPEFMLCGCDPSEKKRRNEVDWEYDKETVDTKFSFDKRNFLARGGELYYLHILQGLKKHPEKRDCLEKLLQDMVLVECKKISNMASFIQDTWEKEMGFEKEALVQPLHLSFIPENAYIQCEQYTIDELTNYLSCKMHPINRVDILAKGVMYQIMRMMVCGVGSYLGVQPSKWIVDMRGHSTTDTVKKLSAESFRKTQDDFMTALNKIGNELNISEEQKRLDAVRKAKVDSLDIFRAKGKELQCIIPMNGPFERYSLSEDVIRFLVLALIKPGEKMTLNMFLEALYIHYGIVIGPDEYRKSLEDDTEVKSDLANSFVENVKAFQEFLKATGFLRELSDATSIVVNPYAPVEVDV
jgi:hypothetical protein